MYDHPWLHAGCDVNGLDVDIDFIRILVSVVFEHLHLKEIACYSSYESN